MLILSKKKTTRRLQGTLAAGIVLLLSMTAVTASQILQEKQDALLSRHLDATQHTLQEFLQDELEKKVAVFQALLRTSEFTDLFAIKEATDTAFQLQLQQPLELAAQSPQLIQLSRALKAELHFLRVSETTGAEVLDLLPISEFAAESLQHSSAERNPQKLTATIRAVRAAEQPSLFLDMTIPVEVAKSNEKLVLSAQFFSFAPKSFGIVQSTITQFSAIAVPLQELPAVASDAVILSSVDGAPFRQPQLLSKFAASTVGAALATALPEIQLEKLKKWQAAPKFQSSEFVVFCIPIQFPNVLFADGYYFQFVAMSQFPTGIFSETIITAKVLAELFGILVCSLAFMWSSFRPKTQAECDDTVAKLIEFDDTFVCVFDYQQRCLYASQSCQTLVGTSAAELQTMLTKLVDCLQISDKDRFAEMFTWSPEKFQEHRDGAPTTRPASVTTLLHTENFYSRCYSSAGSRFDAVVQLDFFAAHIRIRISENIERIQLNRELCDIRASFSTGKVVLYAGLADDFWTLTQVSPNFYHELYRDSAMPRKPGVLQLLPLIAQEDLARVQQEFQYFQMIQATNFELEYRLKDFTGGTHAILDKRRVHYDADGRILTFSGYLIDWTQQLDTEESKSADQLHLELAVEGIRLAFWTYNFITGHSVANRQWYDMVGYTADEVSCNFDSLERVILKEDFPRVKTALQLYLTGTSSLFECDYRLVTGSGQIIWLYTIGRVIRDGVTNEPVSFTGLSLNISDKKRNDESARLVNRSIDKLSRLESLRSMAEAVAHRFNNILTVVRTNVNLSLTISQALQTRRPDDEELQTIQERLLISLDAMSNAESVGSTLLSVSEHRSVSRKKQSVCRIIQEVLEDPALREKFPAANIQFRQPSQLELFGFFNQGQFYQIIRILLENSIEAITERKQILEPTADLEFVGAVSVTCGIETCANTSFPVQFQSEDTSGIRSYAYCEITDNGSGMNSMALDHAFDPFFSTKFVGRGVGLSIAANFIQVNNGAIVFTSNPGEGTTTRVYIPLEEHNLQSQSSLQYVLVIDDDTYVADSCKAVLSILGYVVDHAANGLSAIERITSEPEKYVCILVDYNMPGLSGLDLLRRLRQITPTAGLVIVSGSDEADLILDFDHQLPNHFLQKPLNIELLQSILKSCSARYIALASRKSAASNRHLC